MDDIRFADHIQQERDRLHQEREAIFSQQQELESRLAALNREFEAIDAYEAAKTGKAVRSARQSRWPSYSNTAPWQQAGSLA